MPYYYYLCDPNQNGCGQQIELNSSMSELDAKEKQIRCPNCKKKKPIHRVYSADTCATAYIPQTLGTLADRNSAKFSDDYKAHLDNIHNPKPKDKPWIQTDQGMIHRSKLHTLDKKKRKNKKGKNE